jgi:predicted AlkP superfamily phosphohydrolase/phosphomutase
MRRVAEDWLPYEPFWYELERRGHRVIAIDVPMTFHPHLDRGVEILSWGSHDTLTSFAAFPLGVEKQIRRRFGKHPMGSEITVSKSESELESIRSRLIEGARRKGELCRWLLEASEWDFFAGVFGECHRGGHILWPEKSNGASLIPEAALLDVYRAVDREVGELIEMLSGKGAKVILFALHGMSANASQEHFVPKIMDRVNKRYWKQDSTFPAENNPKGQRSVMRLLRERLPDPIQNAIGRAVPVSVRDAVVNRFIAGGHDWSKTPGFPLLADYNGYIRLNIRGRERDGYLTANSDELRKYVDWVCECFRSFRIEQTGEPLVRDICFATKEFSGERKGLLPDLIVTWTGAPPADRIVSEKLGTVEASLATGRTGNHRPEGFCVFLDSPAGRIQEAPPVHIKDLAGMVLRSFS